MNILKSPIFVFMLILGFSSCVSKKKFIANQELLQGEIDKVNNQLNRCNKELLSANKSLNSCESDLATTTTAMKLRLEQIEDLKAQLNDLKGQRDKQFTHVEDLAILSQSANENINKTLSQLESKDKYILLLQSAKTKVDSINLALGVNLKSVLRDGIDDNDIEIKVDKTVVFINLSDKMLYQSGSSKLTPKAYDVLSKVAKIIESRPDLEVMVEGYTDNVPISNSCVEDNWDLSVKRATSVVRVLQKNYSVDPDRLIAAGRGEYNKLAANDTAEGRALNRRTRIIILPKINQFYDLLNPDITLD